MQIPVELPKLSETKNLDKQRPRYDYENNRCICNKFTRSSTSVNTRGSITQFPRQLPSQLVDD